MSVDEIIKQVEDDLVLCEGEGGWVEMGSKRSGHYGHKGRKGKRGGSAPSKGGGIPAKKLSFDTPLVKEFAEPELAEWFEGIPSKHLRGIKEIRVQDYPLEVLPDRTVHGRYDPDTKIITINAMAWDAGDVLKHEVGEHRYATSKLSERMEREWDYIRSVDRSVLNLRSVKMVDGGDLFAEGYLQWAKGTMDKDTWYWNAPEFAKELDKQFE